MKKTFGKLIFTLWISALAVCVLLMAGCSAGSAAKASLSPGASPAALAPSPSPVTVPSASASPSPAASGEAASIVYKNETYGFDFTLPESWKGYTVVTGEWEGITSDGQGEKTAAAGPELSLRHPLWTSDKPRQDIPIMIFTLDEWDSLQKDEFHIGAAPIGPSELGRNSKYVFALPARYNYAFPEGYEEVDTILSGSPLVPTEKFGK